MTGWTMCSQVHQESQNRLLSVLDNFIYFCRCAGFGMNLINVNRALEAGISADDVLGKILGLLQVLRGVKFSAPCYH